MMISDLEKKTYYKQLVRRFVTDVYLGKWLRMKVFHRWVEPRLGLDGARGARALDLGAGDGILAFYLSGKYPELEVTGGDMDEPQVKASEGVARRLNCGNLNFRLADILAPAADAPFDFIFTLDILEHIEDDAAAVKKCAEILAPGGLWTISVPNRLMLNEKGEWVPSIGPPDHVRTGYDLDALENLVRNAGLEPVFHHYYLGKKMMKAWGLFCRLDRIARPVTLLGMPYYKLCFQLESDPAPESGNGFFLVVRKPT